MKEENKECCVQFHIAYPLQACTCFCHSPSQWNTVMGNPKENRPFKGSSLDNGETRSPSIPHPEADSWEEKIKKSYQAWLKKEYGEGNRSYDALPINLEFLSDFILKEKQKSREEERAHTLAMVRELINGKTHTPIDANAYIKAVREAKAPFDDGFNHGRECAYEHVESILTSLSEPEQKDV